MNIAIALREAALRNPAATALIDIDAPEGRRVFDYAGIWDAVSRCAGTLRAAGIVPGDRVALLTGNSWEYVVAFFAVVAAGGVVVPLNVRLLREEHEHMLRDSGARLLIIEDAFRQGRDGLERIPDLGAVVVR